MYYMQESFNVKQEIKSRVKIKKQTYTEVLYAD